jgi:hypothetical protein
VSVAMPIAMVIEKAPVYSFLAEDSLDLPHFPAHFLQNYSYNLNPININIEELIDLAAFSVKFNAYLLKYLFKIIN